MFLDFLDSLFYIFCNFLFVFLQFAFCIFFNLFFYYFTKAVDYPQNC